jgi:hypothetical protein
MQEFDEEADVHLGRFPSAEEYLRTVTSQMSGYVSQERQRMGSRDAAVDRSQLDVAAHQISFDTIQLRNSAQSLGSSLENSLRSMTAETQGFQKSCGGANLVDLTPEGARARTEACKQLSSGFDLYRKKADALAQGLSHFRQTYAAEARIQEGLLQTADQLR